MEKELEKNEFNNLIVGSNPHISLIKMVKLNFFIIKYHFLAKSHHFLVSFTNAAFYIIFMSREKIYKVYFENKNKKLYFNQLKELSGLSNSSLQNLILKLEKDGEIIREKTKSNVFYILTNKFKSLEFTRISLELIENLNVDVKIPINELINKIFKRVFSVIFFGSSSLGLEKDGSDLDILVILNDFEDINLKELYDVEIKKEFLKLKNEIESHSLYPLSIVFVNKKDFIIGSDYLIKEAKKTGFPIVNQFNYFGEFAK